MKDKVGWLRSVQWLAHVKFAVLFVENGASEKILPCSLRPLPKASGGLHSRCLLRDGVVPNVCEMYMEEERQRPQILVHFRKTTQTTVRSFMSLNRCDDSIESILQNGGCR